MKRCAKCIMPSTALGITLDEDGLCNLCRDYKEFKPKGEEALRKVIAPFVEDRPHNCLVPVSGGRDSAYALYVATKVLGLRPIAYHNDNDFESEAAKKNLIAMSEAASVPLVRTSSIDKVSKKIVAEKFMMNAPFGPGLVAEQTCEACQYGFEAGGYNTARREGVRLIIWGDSTDESTEPYHALIDHTDASFTERLKKPQPLALFNYLKYKYHFKRMHREYGERSSEGLTEVHLFDYLLWDRRVITKTIQEELGWTKPEDSPTSWRIDCQLVPLVNHLVRKAYGVSKIELGFANMVRSGKMDRDDALRQVAEIDRLSTVTDIEQFLKGMGVSVESIRHVLY